MNINPYLNFDGNAEEAFNFYKSVFGGEFATIMRMNEMPPNPGAPPIPDNEKNRVMHVAMKIGDTMLMASDIMPSMGHKLTVGNNFYISINTDTRENADNFFNGLSAGGKIEMAMTDMFWGSYWGSLKDKYGVQWMINYQKPAQ